MTIKLAARHSWRVDRLRRKWLDDGMLMVLGRAVAEFRKASDAEWCEGEEGFVASSTTGEKN